MAKYCEIRLRLCALQASGVRRVDSLLRVLLAVEHLNSGNHALFQGERLIIIHSPLSHYIGSLSNFSQLSDRALFDLFNLLMSSRNFTFLLLGVSAV